MNIDRTLIIIVIIYLIIKKFNKKNKETFGVNTDIIQTVKQIYNTDMESIRKISNMAIDLQNGNFIVGGDLNVTGNFNYLTKGTILAYNQIKAPDGWTLCDGTNGTPDLRGRFILGAGQGANLTNRIINQIGGSEGHILTIEQMPLHNHNNTSTNGDHTHYFCGSPDWGKLCWRNGYRHSFWNGGYGSRGTYNSGDHSHTIPNQGGNQPHNNMPPFFVLTYIMKL